MKELKAKLAATAVVQLCFVRWLGSSMSMVTSDGLLVYLVGVRLGNATPSLFH